jgi:4-amino-4-deoxy-L-arabinose transferase-like glycosyltransferase
MLNEQTSLGKNTKHVVVFAVIVFAILNSSWALSKKTISNHESFVSITAREMLDSGDWIVPTCNGEIRLQKTPLSYWLVAGIAKITGQVDEISARLPSAIFAILISAAILYYVNGWLGFRIAAVSAMVWSSSLGFIRYSHIARPEMALTFFITICFCSFYSIVNAQNRKEQVIQSLIFWISFGLGNLAKGPAPIPMVGVPLFFYVLFYKKWNIIPKMLPIVGVLIFLAISLPWPLAIAYKMNWDMTLWKHEFVDRLFGTYASGGQSWYFYLPMMFPFTVPWPAIMIAAFAAPFYKIWQEKQKPMFYLWLIFVADLIFVTVNGGKRDHYILPIMPAMCVLIGILLEDMLFTRKAYLNPFVKKFFLSHIAVCIVGAVSLPFYFMKTDRSFLNEAIILSAVILAVSILTTILFAKGKPAAGFSAICIGYFIAIVTVYQCFIIPKDFDQTSKAFAQKIASIVPEDEKLVSFKSISSRSVHYLGRVVLEAEDVTETYERYKKGSWIIASGKLMDELTNDGRFMTKQEWTGKNISDGQIVDGAVFHTITAVENGKDK